VGFFFDTNVCKLKGKLCRWLFTMLLLFISCDDSYPTIMSAATSLSSWPLSCDSSSPSIMSATLSHPSWPLFPDGYLSFHTSIICPPCFPLSFLAVQLPTSLDLYKLKTILTVEGPKEERLRDGQHKTASCSTKI